MQKRLSQSVISCAFEVSNQLGSGFQESVYEHALCVELKENGINYDRQQPVDVFYKGHIVGTYVTDLVVEGKLLLELKALAGFTREHDAQILNYLKATGIRVGLLLNFGTPKIGIRRIVRQYEDAQRI